MIDNDKPSPRVQRSCWRARFRSSSRASKRSKPPSATSTTLSHTMYCLNSLRKSTPPQNRQLIGLIRNSEHRSLASKRSKPPSATSTVPLSLCFDDLSLARTHTHCSLTIHSPSRPHTHCCRLLFLSLTRWSKPPSATSTTPQHCLTQSFLKVL